MEQIGPSTRCPECDYGLLTAAFLNFEFFNKSHCPYCGTAVRWALKPLLAILIGVLSVGTGFYFLKAKTLLPLSLQILPEVALGLGACLVLLGLFSIRFETPKQKAATRHYSRVRSQA